MRRSIPRLFLFFLAAGLLAGCNLPQANLPTPDMNEVATRVEATLLSLTQPAQPTPLASPQSGERTPLASPTAEPSNTPLVPTIAASPSPTITLEASLTPQPGTIAGNIVGYPYGSVPKLVIIAYDQHTTYLMYWYWITGAGQTAYSMDGYVPPSTYQVVAYDASGHSGGCTTLVVVTSGQTANCDITDWSGSYPAKPSKVPNP